MSLATLTPVFGQPVITQQPQNQTNLIGTTATFSVIATGAPPLSYQWILNSLANHLPDATNGTLILPNVQASNAGNYRVVITNEAGSVLSASARLTVVFPPVITNQPASLAGVRGYPVTFRVGASGTPLVTYQWYFNDTRLPDQTNASLTLPPVSDLDAGGYLVTVMNPYGAATSCVARLTVGADFFTKVAEGPGSGVANSRGGAWGDYDNDGFIDFFVPQSGPGETTLRHLLYHNNTNGTFSRVTNGQIAEVVSAGFCAAWGDYDNDGYLDLVLLTANQRNYLFHNDGEGSFTAITNASMVTDITIHRSLGWVDYDKDGYLDLFSTVLDQPRRLYRNNRDGTFTRITQGGFLTAPGVFAGVVWADYNNDGLPDLFLPNAIGPNYLYRNDGGGAFTRVGAGVLDGNSSCNTAAWGDHDNDGDLDLFVTSYYRSPDGTTFEGRANFFYRNNGDGTFTSLTSLPANDPEYQGGVSLGCNWGDYDNDGWLDLFVANRVGQNDFLYHNNGDGTFTKMGGIAVNDAAGGDSHGAAWGDYDNDGFLDLFVGTLASTNRLYHNNGNDNHWIKFRLIGTLSNRAAIGAKIRVRATISGQSFWQLREVPGGDGVAGQNSLHVHFGLGDATNADLVRIEWPSGTVQELSNVASKQFLTVTEPGSEPRLAAERENGQVQLTLTGKQGSRYALETSTALPNWSSANLMVTVTNRNGALIFPAPSATNDVQRFYRARWQ